MSEPVQNAQQMESTRTDGPPPSEPTSAKERVEAYQNQEKANVVAAEQARVAKLPPVEQRIAKANANPALWDSKHKDDEAARRELREAVAAGATPEERQAVAEAPLEEHRAVFGVEPPAMPKSMLKTYEEEYSGHEQDFLAEARTQGLDARVVRELRDYGINMAIAVEGRPVTAEAMDAFAKKFSGRLKPGQITALRAWWRSKVQGSGGS